MTIIGSHFDKVANGHSLICYCMIKCLTGTKVAFMHFYKGNFYEGWQMESTPRICLT